MLPRFLLVTVLAWAAGATPATAASLTIPSSVETFEIGRFGARVDLPGPWRRTTIVAGAGRDQFQLSTKNGAAYATFVESEFLLDNAADHRRVLEHIVENLEASERGAADPKKFEFEAFEDHERGSIAVQMMSGRIASWHDISILSRDGLGFQIEVWVVGGDRDEVEMLTEEILDGFELPAANSTPALSTEHVEHRVEFDGWSIALDARPCELQPKDLAGDSLLTLASRGDDVRVYFLTQRDSESAVNALDKALATTDASMTHDAPGLRKSILVDGREALREIRPPASDPNSLIEYIAIPLGGTTYLDLRIQYPGPVDCCSGVRRRLVESIRITDPPALDLHPKIEPAKNLVPEFAAMRSVLAVSRHVVALPYGFSNASRAANGDAVIAGPSEAYRVDPTFDSAVSLFRERAFVRSRWVAAFSDRLLTVDDDSAVAIEIAGAAESRTGIEAGIVLPRRDGGSVLIRGARKAPERAVEGFLETFDDWGRDVVLRDVDRAERVAATIEVSSWIDAALTSDDRALVIGVNPPSGTDDGAIARTELRCIPLDASLSTAPSSLGSWRGIAEIAPSDQGVLVSGTQADGVPGVYRVSLDGKRELLLGGSESAGIAELNGNLLFVLPWASDSIEYGFRHVYVAPIADLAPLALACAPLTYGEIETIAVAAIAAMNPRPDSPYALLADGSTLDAFVRAADELSVKNHGRPLPKTGEDLDRLFRMSPLRESTGVSGTILVAALIARAWRDAGAEWVATPESGVDGADRVPGYPADSDFAFGIHPLSVAAFNFEPDRQGWRSVAEDIADLGGRKAYIGLNSEAVAAAVHRAANPELMAAVARGDAATVAPILLTLRSNVVLRRAVYRRLTTLGFVEAMRDVADAFLADGGAPAPQLLDVHASLAAKTALARDAQAAKDLVPAIRAAIEKQGAIPGLYVLLGIAYERSGIDRCSELARLCFREALALEPPVAVKADAEAGLRRVGG